MTQPSLPLELSTERREKKRGHVATEIERLNAAALRVLAYLQRHGSATNVQLCQPEVGGLRAVGRVFELRKQGYQIEKAHVAGGVWNYTLIEGRK